MSTGDPNDDAGVPGLDDWIIVPNWSKFQHYRDRDPLWIKVYVKLLHDPRYLSLSLASRGLLAVIWLAFASENGAISVRILNKLCGNRVSIPQLVSLNRAGFIRFSASKPLATKTEKEKETPQTPLTDKTARQRELVRRALDLAADWQGNSSVDLAEALDTLERELHTRLPHLKREALIDEALRRRNSGA